jgi:hypothetical protein
MPMMIQVNSVVRHSIPLLFLFSFSAIEPLTPSTQEDPCQASKRRDSKITREISSQNAHLHVCSGICGGIPGGGAPCCTHASHHSQAHSFESKAIQGREYRLQPSPRAVPEGQRRDLGGNAWAVCATISKMGPVPTVQDGWHLC